MKVTYKWLQEFVDISWSPEKVAEQLTLSGSEVESIEQVPPLCNRIIVGRIKDFKDHPDDSHLKICEVDIGGTSETIVCGAPNVARELHVPVALPGTVLPSGKTIRATKIKGITSGGMICSEFELGLPGSSETVMEISGRHRPGAPFDPDNLLDDTVLNIFINPNRPDCMSVRGIAREVAALSGKPLRDIPVKLPKAHKLPENSFSVEILDSDKCPRYSAAVIKGVHIAPSPYKIQQRLLAVGIRPINNIVDATNYCLMEWGHPLHAFDLNLLSGNKIVVKTARNGELFTTLDEVDRMMNDKVLMICDAERAVAVGGIMGGANSEIREDTTDLLLECAYFQPNNILRSAKYLGISTEASRRFERGMDPNFCIEGLERLCSLILSLSPGTLCKPFLDAFPKKIRKHTVSVRTRRLNSLLGTRVSTHHVEKCLKKLDMSVHTSPGGKLDVSVPTFRHDITREEDLVEEYVRISGLNKVEPLRKANIPLRNVANPEINALSKIRTILTQFGFVESYNYSMIDIRLKDTFLDRGKPIALKNPISPELELLRPSLLPGLLQTAVYNLNRGIENQRIFELGTVYSDNLMGKKGRSEAVFAGGLLLGSHAIPSWDQKHEMAADIYTVKGIVESFFRKISLDKIEINPYDIYYMDQSCALFLKGEVFGIFGRYRDGSLNIEAEKEVYLFEFAAEPVVTHLSCELHVKPFSKFPPVKRDLAFVIPDDVPVTVVLDELKNKGGSLLKSVTVKDVYKGKPIPEDSRSVRTSMKFYADDRNLLDEEINAIIDTMIDSIRKKFAINIRR